MIIRSLRWRLVLAMVLIIAAVAATSGLFSSVTVKRELDRFLIAQRRDEARAALQLFRTHDVDDAMRRAHEQFRWFAGGWKVNAELPGPAGFAGATQFVRPEDVADNIPCGPDLEPVLKAAEEFRTAGFTDLAFVQVGDERQEEFVDWAEKELLPALRD